MADEPLPLLDPVEALAVFRAKGYEIGFDWRDIWQEEHAKAFTVAKAMNRDLLEDIRAAVDRALAEGRTLKQFQDELRPKLAEKGWWGRKRMVDPQTGEERVVQLGSPARLQTIFHANLRTSHMAGRWQRIQRAKRTMPLLRYVSVMDGRERPEHHDWHGTILPVDHEWWDTHFPPCGWRCRCDAQPLNQRMMERKGWTVQEPPRFPERDYINRRTGEITRLERGIDPGWSYNPGKAALDGLTPPPRTRDQGELQATLSEASYDLLRGFFAPFGLDSRERAIAGRVWLDAAGWPMAISAGLLRDGAGAILRLTATDALELVRAGHVLRNPDAIGWIWVMGEDSRAMLVRRYTSAIGTVDVGRAFWRWRPGTAAVGRKVWTREDGVLAAYDPRQPRHPKGSRDGGKFRSTGRGNARAAIGSVQTGAEVGQFKRAILGTASAEAAAKAQAAGVDIAGKGITLDRSAAIHIIDNHGPKARRRPTERAMTNHEIVNAHRQFNSSATITRSGIGRDGMPRISADGPDASGKTIRVVADISKRAVNVVTMFHVVPGRRKKAPR